MGPPPFAPMIARRAAPAIGAAPDPSLRELCRTSRLPPVANLIDSGWAAWLPFELVEALEARDGRSAQRRAFRQRLERGPSDADRERWQRFALVCPSRIDLPVEDGLDEQGAYRVLDDLG